MPKKQPVLARILFGAQTVLMLLGLLIVYYFVIKGRRFIVMPGDGSFPSSIPLLAAYIHFGLAGIATVMSGMMTFIKKNPFRL